MSRKPNKQKQEQPKVQSQPRDPGGISWAIVSFLVAPAGFILWFLWRKQRPKTAAMCLRGAGLFIVVILVNMAVGQFVG